MTTISDWFKAKKEQFSRFGPDRKLVAIATPVLTVVAIGAGITDAAHQNWINLGIDALEIGACIVATRFVWRNTQALRHG